jgi:hypothetical protein
MGGVKRGATFWERVRSKLHLHFQWELGEIRIEKGLRFTYAPRDFSMDSPQIRLLARANSGITEV